MAAAAAESSVKSADYNNTVDEEKGNDSVKLVPVLALDGVERGDVDVSRIADDRGVPVERVSEADGAADGTATSQDDTVLFLEARIGRPDDTAGSGPRALMAVTGRGLLHDGITLKAVARQILRERAAGATDAAEPPPAHHGSREVRATTDGRGTPVPPTPVDTDSVLSVGSGSPGAATPRYRGSGASTPRSLRERAPFTLGAIRRLGVGVDADADPELGAHGVPSTPEVRSPARWFLVRDDGVSARSRNVPALAIGADGSKTEEMESDAPPPPPRLVHQWSLEQRTTQSDEHGLEGPPGPCGTPPGCWREIALEFPAVPVSVLIAMLDVPFGLILFPPPFADELAAVGVSIVYVSAIAAQIAMSSVSSFRCGLGGTMVENIAFIHPLSTAILEYVKTKNPAATPADAIPTVLMAIALTTALAAASFLLLAHYRLGNMLHFFPRHVLVGCIGGIVSCVAPLVNSLLAADAPAPLCVPQGAFLVTVGMSVSTGIDWMLDTDTLTKYFDVRDEAGGLSASEPLFMWLVAASLTALLRILRRFSRFGTSALFEPCFFLLIPCVFYCVIAIVGIANGTAFSASVEAARQAGWLYPSSHASGSATDIWAWKYRDFSKVEWGAISGSFATITVLVLFSLIHAPIKVPATSIATGKSFEMNRELRAHGWANLLSTVAGGSQAGLMFANSVLFYNSGGGAGPGYIARRDAWETRKRGAAQPLLGSAASKPSRNPLVRGVRKAADTVLDRWSGFLSTLLIVYMFSLGPDVVKVMPRCLAGTLMFHLGVSLLLEGIVEPWKRLNWLEYFTVVGITVVMTLVGFEEGVLVGLFLACLSFIVQASRQRVIRVTRARLPPNATFGGLSKESLDPAAFRLAQVRSTTQRNASEEAVLDANAWRIVSISLSSSLFFGNLHQIAKALDVVMSGSARHRLSAVFDFAWVTSMDCSAAEAIVNAISGMLAQEDTVVLVATPSDLLPYLYLKGLVDATYVLAAADAEHKGVTHRERRERLRRGQASRPGSGVRTDARGRILDCSKHPRLHLFRAYNPALSYLEDELLKIHRIASARPLG